MPIYEYRCSDCKKKVSVFFRSLSAVDHNAARCPTAAAKTSRGSCRASAPFAPKNPASIAWPTIRRLSGLDENDPKSMGRWMRKMAAETGEDMPPEFDEVVGRLEAGEDPESIEKSMPELAEADGRRRGHGRR